MTFDPEDLMQSMIESLGRIEPVNVSDLPDISLYMDQVTTFMEKNMEHAKRHSTDKVLTKTMINNYAKNKLLPPPDKKKYDKDHLILLIFIYYFKYILSINDIEKLMAPLSENYFHSKSGMKLEDVYSYVTDSSLSQVESIQEFVRQKFAESTDISEEARAKGATDEERRFIQIFSFICSLSFDVYVKRLMIEKLIDLLHPL
ncbi:MAG: DUF1836 domain-containing protein [Lachnospiraceae bacterium]|nr:DUF1836 domain-containing protein [Lachnospiraceae bacterium]